MMRNGPDGAERGAPRRRTGYLSYWLVGQLSRRLPLPFAYWVGLRVADWFYFNDHRGRAAVVQNLRRIYTYQGIDARPDLLVRMARKTYQFFGRYLVDFFRYSLDNREEIEDRVTVAGLARFQEAIGRQRGVILVTAHLGNWELGGLVLALRGHQLITVYRPMGNRRVDRLFETSRAGRGFVTVPLGEAAHGLVQALRQGRIVALLADRDFSHQLDTHVFFGAPARLPRGPAVLAARTRACLVPGFLVRNVDDTYMLEFTDLIDPLEVRGVEALQQRITANLEQAIGRHPYQWFIFDDFWQSSGGGAADPRKESGS